MIYIVEDDDNIRELVVYTLNSQGLEARGFAEGASFRAAVKGRVPRLVLLDIMLPGEDGLQLLHHLRENPETRHTPVIMLTARGSEVDRVVGLDSGADDYIPKPFGMMELLARIRVQLRRGSTEEAEYRVGELSVCPARHQVCVNGEPVTLTLKEYELLSLLMENPGIAFTRARLLNRIWGYEFDGESRTVDVHIRTLRQKLGPAGRFVETVRGVGYRLREEP